MPFRECRRRVDEAIEHAQSARTSGRSAVRRPPTRAPRPRAHKRRQAIARCELCIEQTTGTASRRESCSVLGGLYAMQGSFDHARSLVAKGRALLEELALDVEAARVDLEAWRVEMLAGDVDAAEREVRRGLRRARRRRREVPPLHGRRVARPDACSSAAIRWTRRSQLAERTRELATEADVGTQALWRCLRGRILARRGKYAEAEASVREGLAVLAATDALLLQLDAQLDLGEVLSAAGRTDDAREAYEAALSLAEQKGGVVAFETIGRRIGALDTAP